MEGPAELAMEDDGSLLIISRISEGSSWEEELEGDDDDTMPAITLKSGPGVESEKVPEKDKSISSNEAKPTTSVTQAEVNSMGLKEDMIRSSDNDAEVTAAGSGKESMSASLDMESLDKLLEMELQNLESVRMANENIKKAIATSSMLSPPISKSCPQGQLIATGTTTTTQESSKTIQNPWRRLTNFRRRRNPPRLNPSSMPLNFQHFIQDYYRSLDSFSRYLIAASVIGFTVAFILLSWHGSQIHRNDMELFQLKEKQFVSQQDMFERSQQNHEHFRESMIHQRYEETRECHSTLKSYLAGRDGLLEQIARLKKDKEVMRSMLEAKVESQREEILQLQRKLQELQMQVAQSLSSSYTQILFGFLNVVRNRGVQLALGGFVTVAALFLGMISAFCKSVGRS